MGARLIPRALAFLLLMTSQAQSALPPALQALQPMIQRLCTKSPEIVTVNEGLSLAIQSERVNSLYLIPKVNLGASFGLIPTLPGNETGIRGAGSSGLLGATADWGLSPLTGPHLESEKAKLALRQAQVLRIQGLQTQIANFLDQILRLSRLKAQEKDLLETQKRLEKQFRIAQSGVRQGIASRRDQQRFETEVLRLQESRLSLERSRVETEEGLRTLLDSALDPDWDLPWQGFGQIQIENPNPDIPTPELQLSELRAEISRLDTEIVRARTGWVTSLQGQYVYQNSTLAPGWNSDSIREPWVSNWSLFLNFRYPLWDNGADDLARRQALVSEKIEEVSVEKARREFQATLRLFLDQRRRVEERRRLANKLFSLERQTFAQVEIDYREGRIGYLEWLNSNQSFQASVSSQIDSSIEWARLWILSASLKGELANDFCQ